MKKTFIIISSVIAAALLAMGIYACVEIMPSWFDNTKYYSSEQMQDAYDDGYNAGADRLAEIEAMLGNVTNLLSQSEQTLQEKNNLLATATAQRDELALLVDSQAETIAELQALAPENAELTALVERLTEENSEMAALLASNAVEIQNLRNQVSDLQQQIIYLQILLENTPAELCGVVFMFNGNVYNEQTVAKGDTPIITDPVSSDEVIFLGWSIDGETIIEDISTYAINESTTFVAVVQLRYVVRFVVNGAVEKNYYVDKNDFATGPAVNDTKFLGWSVDGETIIDDISTYPITATTTFTALFRAPIFSDLVTLPEFVTNDRVYRSIAYNNLIYFASDSGKIAIYNPATQLVNKTVAGPLNSIICLYEYEGLIYAGGLFGNFAIFNPATETLGALITTPFGTSTINSCVEYNGLLYVVGNSGKFAIFNPVTKTFGALISTPFGTNSISKIFEYNGLMYVGSGTPSASGNFAIFNPVTQTFGDLISAGVGGIRSIGEYNGLIYLGGTNNSFVFFNPVTQTFGDLITTPLKAGSVSFVVEYSGLFYTADESGNFAIYNPVTERVSALIPTPFGTNSINSIVAYNGLFYLGGANRSIAIYGL